MFVYELCRYGNCAVKIITFYFNHYLGNFTITPIVLSVTYCAMPFISISFDKVLPATRQPPSSAIQIALAESLFVPPKERAQESSPYYVNETTTISFPPRVVTPLRSREDELLEPAAIKEPSSASLMQVNSSLFCPRNVFANS